MSVYDQMLAHLSRFETAPVLFVGAGLSRRYLGLENWEALLARFSNLTTKPYAYYRAQANNDLPSVATLIAEELNSIWWTDAQFTASRDQFSDICLSHSSALKIEIARYLSQEVAGRAVPTEHEAEVASLKSIVADGVITTNWDGFLETIFPDFRVYIGQEPLLFGSPQGIAEIYKIHGCCKEPNSLVLTKEDYDNFHKKNPYLAAKLLATFIEHPVVFLGYSLSDPNITAIISSISGCLDGATVAKLQDRLIFVEWDQTEEEGVFEGASLLQNGITIPVKRIRTADFTPVYAAMGKVKRRFPAKLLRRLKEQVYDLVLNNDPRGRLFVKDINAGAEEKDFEIVLGVGAIRSLQEKGHVGLKRYDLLRDVVFEANDLDSKSVIKYNLEEFLAGAKYVPVFKYLREAGLVSKSGKIKKDGFGARLAAAANAKQSSFHPPNQYKKAFERSFGKDVCLGDLQEKRGTDGIVFFAPLLETENIDLEELQAFLKAEFDKQMSESGRRSNFSRLICFYDWLRNGPGR